MTDVLIIGAGPAGLTAAIYARRAGFSVLVLEAVVYGGQVGLLSEVENYPPMQKVPGWQLAQDLYEHAVSLGAEVKYEQVTEAFLTEDPKRIVTPKAAYEAKSVIIANGAQRKKLGAKGEARLTGRGVSYCATCDGAMMKGKRVAVAGGGNTAAEDAAYLSRLCEKVYVIYRKPELEAEQTLKEALSACPNVEYRLGYASMEITGEELVDGLRIQNLETGEEETLAVSGVFVAVGTQPDNAIFARDIEVTPQGYLAADESCKTRAQGVFAAGDTRTKVLRQIVTAESDGAMAATQAGIYVRSLAARKQ